MRAREPRGAAVRSSLGFTLIELLTALALGIFILSAAMGFLITHMRAIEGDDIRESVSRNTRYIAELLQRDVQMAGIDIKSSPSFGTVAVWPGSAGDTLMVLYVPVEPSPAPPHDIDVTAYPEPPAGEGTCGDRCLDLRKVDGDPLELTIGDLARLDVNGVRRLILTSSVTETSSTQFELEFTDADTLLRQQAGLAGNFQIRIPGTYVQKLETILFYLDDQQRLLRARGLNTDGTPNGEVVAYGVQQFDVELKFADGDELAQANPVDSDNSNDYDDVVGVKVTYTVRAPRADPRVNHGELLTRTAEVRISPRNLRYEKNRMGG
jgi:hypothetical protein